MTIGGLRQRLAGIDGVADIQLDLTDEGLSGIRVTLQEGAEEAMVLERIRAMLVTYGLRPPDQVKQVEPVKETTDVIAVLGQEGDRMRVEVRGRGETIVSVVDPSPLNAARAVASARAQITGSATREVIWIGLDQIGGYRILTVLTALDASVVAGAAVVESDWADALNQALAAASA